MKSPLQPTFTQRSKQVSTIYFLTGEVSGLFLDGVVRQDLQFRRGPEESLGVRYASVPLLQDDVVDRQDLVADPQGAAAVGGGRGNYVLDEIAGRYYFVRTEVAAVG